MAENQRDRGLAAAVDVQNEKIEALRKCVFGNGRPSLEERVGDFIREVKRELTERIEQVKRHGDKNMEQGDLDVLGELQHERKERERQHIENKEQHEKDKKELTDALEKLGQKVDTQGKSLGRILSWALGIGIAFMLLKTAEDLGFVKVLGAQEAQHKIQSTLNKGEHHVIEPDPHPRTTSRSRSHQEAQPDSAAHPCQGT